MLNNGLFYSTCHGCLMSNVRFDEVLDKHTIVTSSLLPIFEKQKCYISEFTLSNMQEIHGNQTDISLIVLFTIR